MQQVLDTLGIRFPFETYFVLKRSVMPNPVEELIFRFENLVESLSALP